MQAESAVISIGRMRSAAGVRALLFIASFQIAIGRGADAR
jgi:hypothetical protein